MNTVDQAKSSFKTFLITLTVSLVVFSAIYYFATSNNKPIDIEGSSKVSQNSAPAVAGVQTASLPEAKVEKESAFRALASSTVADSQSAVLAETTQSSVPGTGIEEVTYGLILSMGALIMGVYFLLSKPRFKAMSSFENDVTRGL